MESIVKKIKNYIKKSENELTYKSIRGITWGEIGGDKAKAMQLKAELNKRSEVYNQMTIIFTSMSLLIGFFGLISQYLAWKFTFIVFETVGCLGLIALISYVVHSRLNKWNHYIAVALEEWEEENKQKKK